MTGQIPELASGPLVFKPRYADHAQTTLTSGVSVDAGLANLLSHLHSKGVKTCYSCQGENEAGEDPGRLGYIMFETADDLEKGVKAMSVLAFEAGRMGLVGRIYDDELLAELDVEPVGYCCDSCAAEDSADHDETCECEDCLNHPEDCRCDGCLPHTDDCECEDCLQELAEIRKCEEECRCPDCLGYWVYELGWVVDPADRKNFFGRLTATLRAPAEDLAALNQLTAAPATRGKARKL